MRHYIAFFTTIITTLSLLACSQDELRDSDTNSSENQIVATIENPIETRTAVGATDGTSTTILWTSGDKLGVFDAAGGSQVCYQKVGAGSVTTAVFTATGTSLSNPKYAYHPYNEANNGIAATALLSGTVPATQDQTDGTLKGDYKVGSLVSSTDQGHSFTFTHLFAVGNVVVDASGTPLADESLEQVNISVAASDGTATSLAGGFTFDVTASTPSYNRTGTSATTVSLTWAEGSRPSLATTQTGHAVFFPEVKTGSTFTIEVLTQTYRAQFTAEAKVNLQAGYIYTFPVTVNNYETLKVYDRTTDELLQDGPYTDTGDNGSTGTDGTITGTFTCATLNVDGLPDINYLFSSINPDGPGAEGTTTIGGIINGLGWDFIAVSENFEYNDELVAALTNYNHGEWRGTITSAQLTSRADTDGLGFFWKKDGISATGETWVQFTSEYGGVTGGANTCIKKGFRHYEVTIADGLVVDVYITHMNTYGSSNSSRYLEAQHGQLEQIRDYVLKRLATNNRPAIIMGDTNMRYTRHEIGSRMVDYIAGQTDYEFYDPWVMFHRGGNYPAHGGKSLMILSKFAGDTENDILCSDDQRGEVVDKVWYINVPGAPLQLTATSCENDVTNFTKSTEDASYSGITYEDANGTLHDNYSTGNYTKNVGYADHFPVVVKFEYTYTPSAN